MLQNPPQGKPWVSWIFVGVWTGLVFLTIPFTRSLVKYVSAQWGKEIFTHAVLAVIAVAFVTAAYCVVRYRSGLSGVMLFWLIAIAAVFAGYTIQLGKGSPAEAIHFIQYGVLGVLVYRALAINQRDITIYFSAAIICGIIGTIDEVIQWLTPKRYWDLKDVWINFFAAALVQIAIEKGLKPSYIAKRPIMGNLRFLCRLLILATVVIGLCLFNTPSRINWYSELIPGLNYLKQNESVMTEYGYRYYDSDIGIFYSRLTPDELQQSDMNRALEAATILNAYKDKSRYRDFLSQYTPVNDPFIYEARVHLFRRDTNFSWANRIGQRSDYYAAGLTTAYRENQIVEKYFPKTLHSSNYVWPMDKVTLAQQHLQKNKAFKSPVSRHLITRFSEAQMGIFITLLLTGLILLNQYLKWWENRS